MKPDFLHKKLNDGHGISGVATFTNFLIEDLEYASELDRLLQEYTYKNVDPKHYQEMVAELNRLCSKRELVVKNRVVLTGRAVLARLLAGDNTYSGEINYGALGTGSTAISDSDSVLDTEVKRKQPASLIRTNDQIICDFYYSKADTNGTYQEFGMFIDGTSVVDTGQLYNRLLTGGWVKTSLESMTVSVQINLNAV